MRYALNSRFHRMAKHTPVFGLTAARLQIQVPIRPSPGEVSGTRCAIFRRDAVVVQCLRRRLESRRSRPGGRVSTRNSAAAFCFVRQIPAERARVCICDRKYAFAEPQKGRRENERYI